MTITVRSYAQDAWVEPAEAGSVADSAYRLLDPSTGAQVGTIPELPLDTAAMVRHAREVGGPALRAMTFHERARLLEQLGEHLMANVATLHEAYGTVGATKADAQVDVEGGIQTMQFYAGLGQRKLPDTPFHVEGDPVRLGKHTRGQVIHTPRHGVAVLIGAYNFPVWGFLEKLGPTILAGLPVIIKPAPQTGHIAEVAVALMVESGLLPDGVVQLVSGGPRDVLDHLGGQDVIAFTGSSRTAAFLRAHPAVVQRGALLTCETDSLNVSVLGPDVPADHPLFEAFIKRVRAEMTSKTGQKCTAIRRILVPTERVPDVVAALKVSLAKVVVGDPSTEGVTMGPLVSREQADSVRETVRRLATECDVAIGGADVLPELASGNPESGAFFAPTVLVAREGARAVHDSEPFGPVSTVVAYTDMTDAARLATLGEGSLVASLVTNSPEAVATFVNEAGSFHGRVLVLDDVNAVTAAPHGAVLPQSIHGGPGRAGGGEELGGVRGVLHLMQATSLTGSAQMLADYTQVWNKDAAPIETGVHPFRRSLSELRIGETLFTESRTVTKEDVEHFAAFTGDTFYAHMDDEAAAASPIFGARVAHGYLILAFAAGLFVDPAPGPVLANFGLEKLRFRTPLYFGDSMHMRLTVKSKAERPGTEWGEVSWDCEVRNQKDEVVATYTLLTINALT